MELSGEIMLYCRLIGSWAGGALQNSIHGLEFPHHPVLCSIYASIIYDFYELIILLADETRMTLSKDQKR
jgi:hypothetical protein